MPAKKPKPDPRESEKRLKAAEDRKRRAAMGPPLDFSDSALEEAATVRQSDVQSALAWWRKSAPPEFRDLLDATPMETE